VSLELTVSLSIKDVPEEILERLRARADRNHRSLQKELLAIVEAAALEESEAARAR
jgi:plasmid stability protein